MEEKDVFMIAHIENDVTIDHKIVEYVDDTLNNDKDLRTLVSICEYDDIIVVLCDKTPQKKILDSESHLGPDTGTIYIANTQDSIDIITSVYSAIADKMVENKWTPPYTTEDFRKKSQQAFFKKLGFVTSNLLKDCEKKWTEQADGYEINMYIPIHFSPN